MTAWERFFKEKVTKIFNEKKSVIDVGGGLRAIEGKGNRFDPTRAWIKPMIQKVNYKIMDPVPDYSPDILGDIQEMPLPSDSTDAIFCLAVLEHVENPIKACHEIHRVLRSGGYCLLYLPFLFYYHAEKGYYKDYWRFTRDSIAYISKDFKKVEIQEVRGAVETWTHLSPFGKFAPVRVFARLLDKWTGKSKSKQVSGYYVFLTK